MVGDRLPKSNQCFSRIAHADRMLEHVGTDSIEVSDLTISHRRLGVGGDSLRLKTQQSMEVIGANASIG
jgi:hypothetical protein